MKVIIREIRHNANLRLGDDFLGFPHRQTTVSLEIEGAAEAFDAEFPTDGRCDLYNDIFELMPAASTPTRTELAVALFALDHGDPPEDKSKLPAYINTSKQLWAAATDLQRDAYVTRARALLRFTTT